MTAGTFCQTGTQNVRALRITRCHFTKDQIGIAAFATYYEESPHGALLSENVTWNRNNNGSQPRSVAGEKCLAYAARRAIRDPAIGLDEQDFVSTIART
jgi:hypothetical protein